MKNKWMYVVLAVIFFFNVFFTQNIWVEYINSVYGFSFKKPANLKLSQTEWSNWKGVYGKENQLEIYALTRENKNIDEKQWLNYLARKVYINTPVGKESYTSSQQNGFILLKMYEVFDKNASAIIIIGHTKSNYYLFLLKDSPQQFKTNIEKYQNWVKDIKLR